jgi:transcription elongation factor GreB
MRFLTSRLESARVIDPLTQPSDRVLFGATVEVKEAKGGSQRWRIVGLDETDLDRGWISWMSPIAAALLDRKVGETVPFRDQKLTIEAIRYEAG